MAQGTEVAVEPVGIGLTFTPGQILDPANDLIERFSWIVLASGSSLGIQRVLLDVTASLGFTLLVSAFVVGALFLMWRPGFLSAGTRRALYRLTLVLIIVRFAIPAIAICSEGLYDMFLESQFIESKQQLERTAQNIGEINRETQAPIADGEDRTFFESARRAYESATNAVSIEKRMESLKQAVANVSENAINLIVVFVLQTILFPLLFLWLIIQLVKQTLHASFRFGAD